MMEIRTHMWLGRWLRVQSATDPTLIGANGQIWNETKRTITIREDGKFRKLSKRSITFTIDGIGPIQGSTVEMRAHHRMKKHSRRKRHG